MPGTAGHGAAKPMVFREWPQAPDGFLGWKARGGPKGSERSKNSQEHPNDPKNPRLCQQGLRPQLVRTSRRRRSRKLEQPRGSFVVARARGSLITALPAER